MNVESMVRALADGLNGTTAHEAGAPYLLAFLSSTVVEVIAVAAVLAMITMGAARSVLRSKTGGHAWPRLSHALHGVKLHKMLIPLACLSATVWAWTLIPGA